MAADMFVPNRYVVIDEKCFEVYYFKTAVAAEPIISFLLLCRL